MLDKARGELVSVAAHLPGLPTIRVPLSQGVAGHVASTGEVICIDSCATDSRFWSRVDEKTGYVTRSMLAAPVRGSGGRLLGVAQVLNKRLGTFSEAA
jgi:GAF domain-containing protein